MDYTTTALDYDAYDAVLLHLYQQTHGDTWATSSELRSPGGVCLRVERDFFRVFPYENEGLVEFERAVRVLNPVVAVKLVSAAIVSVLSTLAPDETAIYIDQNTRIQVLHAMDDLPHADKDQCGAFIRDERVLVVWADNLDYIIPIVREFEDKLIKLVWRSRATLALRTSVGGTPAAPRYSLGPSSVSQITSGSIGSIPSSGSNLALQEKDPKAEGDPADPTKEQDPSSTNADATPLPTSKPKKKARFGWRTTKKAADAKHLDEDLSAVEKGEGGVGGGMVRARPTKLIAPFYTGLATGLSLFFIGSGVGVLASETIQDNQFSRFGLLLSAPFVFCVSIFFCIQLVGNVAFMIGPVAQYHENSKYYSAIRPAPNPEVDRNLPHVTIQMPVYKESLKETITPSVESLKRAMQTYARQGGTSRIFINDDGLQLLDEEARNERIEFYADHGIGWVARPPHNTKDADGFNRAGRFKKASNMNYGLALSLKMEKFLRQLQDEKDGKRKGKVPGEEVKIGIEAVDGGIVPDMPPQAEGDVTDTPRNPFGSEPQSRIQSDIDLVAREGSLQDQPGYMAPKSSTANGEEEEEEDEEALERRALQMALDETWAEAENSPKRRPWASVAQARSIRVGEIILIVDSDTVVPEDCLRDAARELHESPELAILQHESDVMQVAWHYFENGIAHFTRRINRCISMACANGEVAPFVGHNAFLRWRALQDAAFVDFRDGVKKIWSEHNVSEDFDMALRLQMKGYTIRWASYASGGFKEGVSLTCDDELNRWQKYAYGCNELLFNPIAQWWRKGPVNKQLHTYVWSQTNPIHSKISMMSYMFSYYGIAAAAPLSLLNYLFLGFADSVDQYYLHSFEIWLACCVVFIGAGNVGFTLLEYRLGLRSMLDSFIENISWFPFFFFFFGGLSIHLTQAILAHLFSYNITWGATKKEVERSNFFLEVPKILRRFWLSFIVSGVFIVGMVVLATPLVPFAFRITAVDWAFIFPVVLTAGCHILYPIVLNPWLMIFSY